MKLRPAGEPRSPRLRPGRHESRSHRVARSVVGPHGIGNCWFSVGTSGHDRYEETAGHHIFPTMTSGSGAARRRVRIPPDGRRGPTALANQAGVTEDGPHPPAELVPLLPGRAMFTLTGRAPDVP